MIRRKVKTSIAQEMEKSGLEARYDNNAKELIAHKIILLLKGIHRCFVKVRREERKIKLSFWGRLEQLLRQRIY